MVMATINLYPPYEGDPEDPNYEIKKDAWEQLGLVLNDEDLEKDV